MAEYVAKRDRKRCPTHPGELLREDVIPATGKTRSEIAGLLGISAFLPHNIERPRRRNEDPVLLVYLKTSSTVHSPRVF